MCATETMGSSLATASGNLSCKFADSRKANGTCLPGHRPGHSKCHTHPKRRWFLLLGCLWAHKSKSLGYGRTATLRPKCVGALSFGPVPIFISLASNYLGSSTRKSC